MTRRSFLTTASLVFSASQTFAHFQDDLEFEQATYLDGEKSIPIEVIRPALMDRPLPAVLLLHGGGRDVPDEGTRGIARGLARRGYIALLPHYVKCVDSKYPNWILTVSKAIDFAVTRPEVKPDAIALYGISQGGGVALSAASKDARVKAVVEWFSGWPGPLPDQAIKKLPPVLMINGDADKLMPVAEAKQLDEALTEFQIAHRFHLYKKVGHGFGGRLMEDGFKKTAVFLDDTLKKPPAQAKSKKKR